MQQTLYEQHYNNAALALDGKTKPKGSLGEIEVVAAQIAALQQTIAPDVNKCRALIFAADHGIASEGVSAFPQEVTHQMLVNFSRGGAAINALCKAHNIELEVINTGVIGEPVPGTVDAKIADGTNNMMSDPAMTSPQLEAAMEAGRAAVVRAQQEDIALIALGEMGIGNTTAAAAMVAALCDATGKDTVGRGTGIDDDRLKHKQLVVNQLLFTHASRSPQEVLRCLGGFEIAALTGAMLQAGTSHTAMVVDGYITTAAALCACAIDAEVRPHLIFAHKSAEAGHQLALDALNAKPLLQLDMRLGEGSGAALAVPVIRSAVAILNEMATFESAGVAGADSTS
jgi:nicotinate-nucleotide--dimethylbenzimidazole phosphoribosyltransferase